MTWRRRPPGSLSDAQARTLAALLRVYARDGRATVRAVAAEAGITLGPAHSQLAALRALGLVAWDEGRRGSLRPLVAPSASPG